MTNKDIICKPIGVIHSEHTDSRKTPIQPIFAEGFQGQAEVFHQYETGLRDIEGFSHLLLFYHFHKAAREQLLVKPFLEDVEHGIFATRAPARPNHIGISLVRLIKREDNILFLNDVDILDKTPLLDIKPYIARFDSRTTVRSGWQEKIDNQTAYKRGRRV